MRRRRNPLPCHDALLLFVLILGYLTASPLPAVGQPASTAEVVINEIMYDPGPDGTEFVELYNGSEQPVDLHALTIADARDRPVPLSLEPRRLRPGEYAILASDDELIDAPQAGAHTLTPSPWPQLNNGGDAVVLSAGGVPIDSVLYDPAWGGDEVSLERVHPQWPSSQRATWAPSTAPNGSTPGSRNSVFVHDDQPPELLTAEQSGPQEIMLIFDEPLASSPTPTDIRCDRPLSISNIHLSNPAHRVSIELSDLNRPTRCTVSSVRDLSGNISPPRNVSPAYWPGPGDLAITELMPRPAADPYDGHSDQPEYLELYNRSERPRTTSGLYWTGRVREDGSVDTTFTTPACRVIPPGAYALIVGAPVAARPDTLWEVFPQPDLPVCLIAADGRSPGLRNESEMIRLTGPSHAVIESMRYESSWHHPDLIDPTGISLERITSAGAADDPAGWSSSTDPSGGTPGRDNSLWFTHDRDAATGRLGVSPSPFSPNGDGYDDHAVVTYEHGHVTGSVRIEIYDARGRPVRTLTPARLSSGTVSIVWDGRDEHSRDLPNGIYVVRAEAVDATEGRVSVARSPVVIGGK